MKIVAAALVAASFTAVVACAPEPQRPAPAEQARQEGAPVAATPAGPPRQLELEPANDARQAEASVNQVAVLKAGGKIYSTVGGDPAINGLYTYFAALSEDPSGGWRVFQIGDFNSWELVEDRGDEAVLRVSRSWIDEGSGEPRTVEELLIVSVPGDGAAPVTVTPAK